MTRKEEIRNAINELIPIHPSKKGRTYQQLLIANGFKAGVVWADEHPVNVWHDASEEPQIGSNIVVVDEDGQWWDIQPYDGEYDGYGDLTGWRCCVVHYNNIQSWAYIPDLLPKGGTNEKVK